MAIWIPIANQSTSWIPTATKTFATSNGTFFVSQTPSLSSSIVEDIEKQSTKRKEIISGNHIIDVYRKYTFKW